MNKVFIVTKNKYKLKRLRNASSNFNISVEQIPEDTFEIQSDSCEEVACFSAESAANKYNKPVVKGDFGFFVDCLNGLPGPYVKHFVNKIGVKKFLKLIEDKDNRKAYIVYAIAYCEPNKEPVVFKSRYDGFLIKELKDKDSEWFTDAFIPDGEELTIGEMRNKGVDFEFFEGVEKKFIKWFVKNKL